VEKGKDRVSPIKVLSMQQFEEAIEGHASKDLKKNWSK